jgi:hypothetical protein
MIKVEFNKRIATVYDDDGRVVNIGERPEDWAFARNVTRAKGYKHEESNEGHKRIVCLYKGS